MTLDVFSSLIDSMFHMAAQVFPFVGLMLNKALRGSQVVCGSGLCLRTSETRSDLRWSLVFGAPISFSSSSLCLRHAFLPPPHWRRAALKPTAQDLEALESWEET